MYGPDGGYGGAYGLICPWLTFGHLLPYMELAERLASRGHRVSFVSAPRNLARLPPPRRPHAGDGDGGIDLVPLTLPRVEGLPDGAESTKDLPGDKFPLLFQAFVVLAAPFAEFLTAACDGGAGGTQRPDWVLVDVSCAKLMSIAAMLAALSCGARDHAELAFLLAAKLLGKPFIPRRRTAAATARARTTTAPAYGAARVAGTDDTKKSNKMVMGTGLAVDAAAGMRGPRAGRRGELPGEQVRGPRCGEGRGEHRHAGLVRQL